MPQLPDVSTKVMAAGCRYEGPDCNININECVRGTDNCPANSGCVDSDGGFSCPCYWGYQGMQNMQLSGPLASILLWSRLMLHVMSMKASGRFMSVVCTMCSAGSEAPGHTV